MKTKMTIIGALFSVISVLPMMASGAVRHTDRVLAGYTDVYHEIFHSNETVNLWVSGDGDTDLDLYVYDENGNLICSDTDTTDEMLCSWTPRWTGEFRLEIVNLGDVYNQYTISIY